MENKSIERHMLSTKQMFQLCTLVAAEYVGSNLLDTEFAPYASKKLGFEVKPTNVKTARGVHDIKSKRVVAVARNKAAAKNLTVLQRLELLEKRIDAWEK